MQLLMGRLKGRSDGPSIWRRRPQLIVACSVRLRCILGSLHSALASQRNPYHTVYRHIVRGIQYFGIALYTGTLGSCPKLCSLKAISSVCSPVRRIFANFM